ncbi:Mobile element protein [Candidatus Synechococcus spongiarum]|uniref:Mobile element protein n=1 Tax=Candidatus Synechococcus spongiarum TaxID=431041 RepID=A0A164YV77_9SYNE|nr:Mobile element protein [Candidatus Synechococcus spongiarum]
MLRMHCVQLCYNVSDPGMEDMLYRVESVRHFSGIRLEKVSDETMILNFRHLLERQGLGRVLFEIIKEYLAEQGLMLKKGAVMDASIIAVPSSTKNRKRERDSEMKQTKKRNQWHFGMKLYIGVDDQSGLVHSLASTAANVHDMIASERLLHGEEVCV